MSKHTPGPWVACRHGDYGDYDGNCAVVLGEGGDIRTAVVLGFDTEENRANKHLIAAAPDLLAACKAMLACCYDLERNDETIAAVKTTMAAIAKATGEQE